MNLLVETARKYLNIPFHHQGRNEFGLDCAGLLIKSLHDINYTEFDTKDYGRIPMADKMLTIMRTYLYEKSILDGIDEGDIVLMRFEHDPQHVGIITILPDNRQGIIHSYQTIGKVIEHGFDSMWKNRVTNVFKLKDK